MGIAADQHAPGQRVSAIGDHGVAVLSQRESLEFETQIVSDTAALHGLVAEEERVDQHLRLQPAHGVGGKIRFALGLIGPGNRGELVGP